MKQDIRQWDVGSDMFDYLVIFLPPFSCLQTENGGIHKMIMNESQAFVIAEYQPFNHRTPILNIIFHPSSVSNSTAYTIAPPRVGVWSFIHSVRVIVSSQNNCSKTVVIWHFSQDIGVLIKRLVMMHYNLKNKPSVLCLIAEEAVCELQKWTGPVGCGELHSLWR